MTITFITLSQAALWAAVTIIAVWVYVKYVRPKLMQRQDFFEFYRLADTQLSRLYEWIKIRWDVALAGVLASLPSVWNGILDGIIYLSIHLADVLPAIAGADLSGLVIPEGWQIALRISAAVVPVIRMKMMSEGEE